MFGPDRPGIFEGKVEDLEQRVMNPAPQDVVLLTGSSYFELWKTSDRDLAGLNTVDVGIGGTRIGDQIHYFDRLVRPFNPSAVVVYAGSNDISAAFSLYTSAGSNARSILVLAVIAAGSVVE